MRTIPDADAKPGDPGARFDVVANYIPLRSSFVGTRQDTAEALALASEGKVRTDVEMTSLSSITEALDRLKHGRVASRVVLDFEAA